MYPYYRKWQSKFANNLKQLEMAATVEEAITKMSLKKLQLAGQSKPPIQLEIVASACGIMPQIYKVEMMQDARLVELDGKIHVQVNTLHTTTKQRFSAAHEISHKIFTKGKSFNTIYCDNVGSFAYTNLTSLEKKEEEIICDIGACNLLLLNTQHLLPILSELGFAFQTVKYVQENFDISFEASVRSLAEINPKEAAAVYFRLGLRKEEEEKANQLSMFAEYNNPVIPKLRVAKHYKSKNFPIKIVLKKSIPESSCITHAFNLKEITNAREVITFDDRNYYEMDIEAIPRNAYFGGELDEGVVALLSNVKIL